MRDIGIGYEGTMDAGSISLGTYIARELNVRYINEKYWKGELIQNEFL